ncbi:universal stress protein [Actinopolymorpha sp. B11F2]|uniref:universal stress protein n=1 Tax=Actinopolymorpha sp. B11F2 TaxID=3160862 RepID=UPI0032E37F05
MGSRGLPPPGAIVVGAHDGSSARGAVIWAARAARDRRCPLVVCHAYQPGRAHTGRELECAERNRAWRTAQDWVRTAQAEVPGVAATAWVASGAPALVLADAVAEPELIVVGFRAHGRLAGDLLASLWARADAMPICPVVAVPSRTGGFRRCVGNGRRRDQGRREGRVVVATVTGETATDVRRFATSEAARSGADVWEGTVPPPVMDERNRRRPGVGTATTAGAGLDVGEPLTALARDAELLVVGMPISSPPLRQPKIARGGGEQVESPPIASLGAALGYGAMRRLTAPIAVVPAAPRPATMVPAGAPGAVRRTGVRPADPAAEGAPRLPQARRPGDDLPAISPVAPW